MAGSRERLVYADERRMRYQPPNQPRYTHTRYEEQPRRKNGYIYEDLYSDTAFDENQGRLSLFRPIRPEYLHLPTSYDKYMTLPRTYQYQQDYRQSNRYKKDYYDFRIERDRRYSIQTERRNGSYDYCTNSRKRREENKPYHDPRSLQKIQDQRNKRTNLTICKQLRLANTEKPRYWTSEPPRKDHKKPDSEKKYVKFSEVSGCSRKTVIDDPVCGRKVVPVRELEVSLDQMIQNGYFEKHNIPIGRPIVEKLGKVVGSKEVGITTSGSRAEPIMPVVPNGKCLSGTGTIQKQTPQPRKPRHLPQVSSFIFIVTTQFPMRPTFLCAIECRLVWFAF